MKYIIIIDYSYTGWYKNNLKHRLYGPAVEYKHGGRLWYKNSNWHREDGPAKEWVNGSKYWYIDDEKYSEEEFLQISPEFANI